MQYRKAKEITDFIGQSHLLKYWDDLTLAQKNSLSEQIKALNLDTFQDQKELLKVTQHDSLENFASPVNDYKKAGNISDLIHGKSIITSGQVGCIVVAGGQGTRLKIDGPKGMCPVSLVKKKTLFQLLSEKTLAAGKQAGRPLMLAIMTSPANHTETVNYFETNRYFGLDSSQVTFFMQKLLPLLNKDGNMFLESPDTISVGPDGNGGALYEFYNQGIFDKWQALGIRYVNFILVDNPLADPFDAELTGLHARSFKDVIIKAIMRQDANENVGLIVKKGTKISVIEYSELNLQDKERVDETGALSYALANISLFSFSMDFIQNANLHHKEIPLHKAFKAVKYIDAQGKTIVATAPMAWKFERYIFDLLSVAEKVEVLVYGREECFAPLKNFKGKDSLETVPYAIESSDRKVLSRITKTKVLAAPLEIAQDFYYPTEEILNVWNGRKINEGGYLSIISEGL